LGNTFEGIGEVVFRKILAEGLIISDIRREVKAVEIVHEFHAVLGTLAVREYRRALQLDALVLRQAAEHRGEGV